MKKLLLNQWRVNHYEPGADLDFLHRPDFVPEGFLKSSGSELVHGILRRYGIICQPVFGKDLDTERWIEERDWVYMTEFWHDDATSPVFLCCEGLDTFCEVYLNGKLLGTCRNMHIPYRFDVTDSLLSGNYNRLVFVFRSPVKAVENCDYTGLFSTNEIDRLYARKAQMNYGWDFCGRSVSAGIWKDVYLSCGGGCAIEDFYLRTVSVKEQSADLELLVDVSGDTGADYSLMCEVHDGDRCVLTAMSPCGKSNDFRLSLLKPKLWWPRPYGEQPLYRLVIKLMHNGKAADTREHFFGVRTIELEQEKTEDGVSFAFIVNGRKLFIRGGNWVPTHTIYSSITDGDYDTLLDYAVEGNLSMLRVWGGGIYESKRFFELCDRLGLLVFQDFMLACGIYPQTEDFLAQVSKEAEIILKQYRNYTCLALWSGDNENDEAYTWAGHMPDFVNDKVNKIAIHDAWQKYDPHRIFLVSSPCSPHRNAPGGGDPNSDLQGDTHVYMCGINPDLPDYYKNIKKLRPRFMSEFGFISFPEKESFYQFNFLRKMPNFVHGEKVVHIDLPEMFPNPDSMDEMIYFFQFYHSLALKYWIEYFRRLKGVCSGCLYWKFNDPVADNNDIEAVFPSLMSAVDFYKRPKMNFYFSKRAYEDTIVFFDEAPGGIDVCFANECLRDICGTLTVSIRSFSGETVRVYNHGKAVIAGDSGGMWLNIPRGDYQDLNPAEHYMSALFSGHGGEHLENVYYFTDIKDILSLKLCDAALDVQVIKSDGGGVTLALTADSFVPALRIGSLTEDVRYSDNYFPMERGREKKVVITGASVQIDKLFFEAINIKRKVWRRTDGKNNT